jgi:hypothetical protein
LLTNLKLLNIALSDKESIFKANTSWEKIVTQIIQKIEPEFDYQSKTDFKLKLHKFLNSYKKELGIMIRKSDLDLYGDRFYRVVLAVSTMVARHVYHEYCENQDWAISELPEKMADLDSFIQKNQDYEQKYLDLKQKMSDCMASISRDLVAFVNQG